MYKGDFKRAEGGLRGFIGTGDRVERAWQRGGFRIDPGSEGI